MAIAGEEPGFSWIHFAKSGLRTSLNPAFRNENRLGLREPTQGSYRRTGGSPRGRIVVKNTAAMEHHDASDATR